MGYIYHIYSEGHQDIYIGQCKNNIVIEKSDLMPESDKVINTHDNRPLSHFSGLYDSDRENPKFQAFMRRYPLSSMRIEIFSEDNYYGLSPQLFKEFFTLWRPINAAIGQVDNTKLIELQDGFVIDRDNFEYNRHYYLDAAEVMHTFYYEKLGYNNLALQMGGQGFGFVNTQTGLTINSTLSPSTLVTILSQDSKIMTAMQKSFNKFLDKQLMTTELNTGICGSATLAHTIAHYTAINWMNHPHYNREDPEWSKLIHKLLMTDGVLIKFLKQYLHNIRDDLDKQFPPSANFTITGIKNLYSQSLDKFKINFTGSHNYTFAQVLEQFFKKKTTKAYLNKLIKGEKVQEVIIQQFTKYLEENIQIRYSNNVSISDFFDITTANTQNAQLLSSKIQITNGDLSTYHEKFHDSLKRISYWNFFKNARKVIQENASVTYPRFIQQNGKIYYIISTYRLSSAIEDYMSRKGVSYLKDDFLWNYVRQWLSIMTSNQGNPMFGNQFEQLVIDDHNLLAFPNVSLNLTLNPLRKNIGEGDTDYAMEYEGMPAFEFGDRSFKAMSEWLHAKIVTAKYY